MASLAGCASQRRLRDTDARSVDVQSGASVKHSRCPVSLWVHRVAVCVPSVSELQALREENLKLKQRLEGGATDTTTVLKAMCVTPVSACDCTLYAVVTALLVPETVRVADAAACGCKAMPCVQWWTDGGAGCEGRCVPWVPDVSMT